MVRMVRCCIRLTRLTLVCEVIRYRLVQVRQNLKKLPSSFTLCLSCCFLAVFFTFSADWPDGWDFETVQRQGCFHGKRVSEKEVNNVIAVFSMILYKVTLFTPFVTCCVQVSVIAEIFVRVKMSYPCVLIGLHHSLRHCAGCDAPPTRNVVLAISPCITCMMSCSMSSSSHRIYLTSSNIFIRVLILSATVSIHSC